MDFKELMARMVELDQPIREADKADKDYDGDGEVESPKDEVWGARAKAAAKSGKPFKEDSEEEKDDDKPVEETLDELAGEVEKEMDECGMGPMNMPNANKQQDTVSMNLSMNGSGSGGIRDLMNILRNLDDDESGHDHGSELPTPSDDKSPMDMMKDLDSKINPTLIMKKEPILGDEFANTPEVQVGQGNFPMDTGDDLHKPKDSYSDKPYRGDNPMALEGLRQRLEHLYNDIKTQ